MIHYTLSCFFLIFLSWGIVNAANETKTVRAVKTSSPVIDGIFHDDEWNYGGLATSFTQYEPDNGKPSTEKTEVYFLYDQANLYVGAKCYDHEPGNVMAALSGRDKFSASDYFEVMLDTYNDHHNAYSFGTTPEGTQIDGKYFNDGEWDTNWDGVWFVESRRTDYGWSVEMKIPFNTLTFPNAKVSNWGMNIQRNIERNKEWTFWQPVDRDEGLKVSNFGKLEALEGIEPGMNLQVLPYLSSGFREDRLSSFSSDNKNGITGVDVRYGVTSNLTAVLTVNPDFAQIEADEDKINLSRYPYILREKRPFFLEGASIFNTAGNSMSDGEYRTALFYSRRINEPVYGLKTTGKIGGWMVGLIHALNDNDVGIQKKIEDGALPASTRSRAFYNVIRMSHNLFNNSQLGIIAMSKEYTSEYNRILGIDGRLRFNNNYNIAFESVKSFTPDHQANNHSVNLYFSHYSDFFKFSTSYQEEAPGFMGNDMGFYDYNNFRSNGAWVQFAPRFRKMGIRKMGNNFNYSSENFQNRAFFDRNTFSYNWNYNFWIQGMNYWMFGAGRADGKRYDRIDEVIYPGLNYWVWMENDYNSKIYFHIEHSQGQYRTGYSWSYYTSLRLQPSNRFSIELNQSRSLAKLIDDDTGQLANNYYQIWRSKFYYNFTRNLNARLILQYNSMESRLDTYYLIAFNFRPGSFLYVAYTERFDSTPFVNNQSVEVNPSFGSSYKILQVKLSYLFQL
jgi:hypothetical protein